MARPLRIEYAGAVYHVTVRGNQGSNIFRSTQDRERFPSPMEALLDGVCQVLEIDRSVLLSRQRESLVRPLAAKALCDFSGMTQREVAKLFNLSSGTAVSKQLARLSVMLNQDKSLRKVQEKINRVVQNPG